MKTTFIAITSVVAASVFAAVAQEPGPTPEPTPGAEWRARAGRMHGAWKTLTPEEQQKVKSAWKTAKGNPEVAQARTHMMEAAKAFHSARKNAMLKADPSLAPVLEKLETARREKGRQ